MNPTTVQALDAINRAFYDRHASHFSATRTAPWPGFSRVVELLRLSRGSRRGIRVLDVGCGNGRFGVLLSQHLTAPFDYCGIDRSGALLEEARHKVSGPGSRSFLSLDLLDETALAALRGQEFSLVSAFGLLHHVPGFAHRRRLVETLARHLEPGGLLALSFWQFAAFPRFTRRRVAWEDYRPETGPTLDLGEIEPGDYLLRWGQSSPDFPPGQDPPLRYCHFVDSREARLLISELRGPSPPAATGGGRPRTLRPMTVFRSDGKGNRLNLYVVMTTPTQVPHRPRHRD